MMMETYPEGKPVINKESSVAVNEETESVTNISDNTGDKVENAEAEEKPDDVAEEVSTIMPPPIDIVEEANSDESDIEKQKMSDKVAQVAAVMSGKKPVKKIIVRKKKKTEEPEKPEKPQENILLKNSRKNLETSKKKDEERKKALDERIQKALADSKSNLIPEESDEELAKKFDKDEKALYDIIHIKSTDVDFTWGTDMLMDRILDWAGQCEDVEGLTVALKHYSHGDILYEKCKPYLEQILELGQKVRAEE